MTAPASCVYGSASRPCPRRIVLVAADGSVERVLATPEAADAHAELGRWAREWPGRRIAAEWLKGEEWMRWLEMTQ